MAPMSTLPCSVFVIELEVEIQAPRAKVFAAWVSGINHWWASEYTIGQKPKSLRIEAKIGGRWMEAWSATEGSLWGTITEFKKNERLECCGSLGMSGAVEGKLGIDFEAKDKNTTILKLRHAAMGEIDEEGAAGFNEGWRELIVESFKKYCEQGPAKKAKPAKAKKATKGKKAK